MTDTQNHLPIDYRSGTERALSVAKDAQDQALKKLNLARAAALANDPAYQAISRLIDPLVDACNEARDRALANDPAYQASLQRAQEAGALVDTAYDAFCRSLRG